MSTNNNQEKTIGEALYTVDQAAEYLQCSTDTVRRMINRGELKASRFGPRMIRINPEDIKAMGIFVAEEATE